MAELDAHYIKRGLWTNWANGPIMGRTITTDSRTGTVLVSIFAVLSALAMSHLWHLITFSIHQSRAHGRPSDGLYWQQQAIFRTLGTPSAVCSENAKLYWLWRRRSVGALKRCAPYIMLPALFVLATIAVSVFTAFVVSTSNIEVLVSSPYCGEVNLSTLTRIINEAGVEARDANTYEDMVTGLAITYAKECYHDEHPKAAACKNTFTRPRIPYEQKRVECPFSREMCIGEGDAPAVSYDTGLLDLNEYLGTNFAKKDRMRFRKKTTCAVLAREGRYVLQNATEGSNSSSGNSDTLSGAGDDLLPGEQMLTLFYGTHTQIVPSDVFENATFTQVISGRKTDFQGM